MSYVQIEAGGRLRGLKFNQFAIVAGYKKMPEGLEDESTGYCLLWGGLVGNCFVKQERLTKTVIIEDKPQEVSVTFEDVCDWYDLLSAEDKKKILDAFDKAHEFQKGLPKEEKKSKVKKSTGTGV